MAGRGLDENDSRSGWLDWVEIQGVKRRSDGGCGDGSLDGKVIGMCEAHVRKLLEATANASAIIGLETAWSASRDILADGERLLLGVSPTQTAYLRIQSRHLILYGRRERWLRLYFIYQPKDVNSMDDWS